MIDTEEFEGFTGGSPIEADWTEGFADDTETMSKEPSLSEKKDLLSASLVQEEEDPLEAYRRLEATHDSKRQEEMDRLTYASEARMKAVMADVAASALVETDVPPEQAYDFLTGAVAINEKKHSPQELLVDKWLASPVQGESVQQEATRIDSSDWVKRVIQRQEIKQKLITTQLIDKNASIGNKVGDFLEYLVPLSENVHLAQVVHALKSGETGITEAMTLMGNSKIDFQKEFLRLNWEQQEGAIALLAAALSEVKGIAFNNDNDLMQEDIFESLTNPDHYGGGLQAWDNVFSVLDLVGVGAILKPFRSAAKGIGAAAGAASVGAIASGAALTEMTARAARLRWESTGVQPNSIGRNADEANPDVAADLHTTAALDETGESANVIYGGDMDSVVARELPQVNTPDGSVENVPSNLSERVSMQAAADGRFDLNNAEEASILRYVQSKLQGAFGVTLDMSKSSMPVRNEDGTFSVNAVYGRPDSPYRDPKYAIEYVKVALRDFDLDDAQFELLRKTSDGQFVPTTLAEIEAKQALRDEFVRRKVAMPEELKKANLIDEYQVRVKFDGIADPRGIEYENTTVRKNFFDRFSTFISGKKGDSSLTRNLIDPHSMFDFRITGGASQAFDKAAALEKELIDASQPFINGFQKLGKDRQSALTQVIKEANFLSKKPDRATLRANGFSSDEIKVLDDWQSAWDDIYHLENRDFKKTLSGQGFKMLRTAEFDYFVRPISEGQAIGKKVYDPDLDEVRVLTKDEVEELYGLGGEVAQSKHSFKLEDGGEAYDFVLARNHVGSSQIRNFRASDKALNYREGYYAVRYEDPYFIVMHRADLQEGGKAIKTARDSQSAEAYIRQLNETAEEGVTYEFRPARELGDKDLQEMTYQMAIANGRISQRVRGNRVGNTEHEAFEMDLGNVQDPTDSLLNSIRSISKRTSIRDYIERYKERFKSQYGDLIREGVSFPDSASDLIVRGTMSNKELADAKSHLEYIHSLEYGYTNAIDESYKALMNVAGEIIGKASPAGERAVRGIQEMVPNPTRSLRARSFETGIALNPLRQAMIQSHQSIMLTANFPKYVFSGMPRDLSAMLVMSKWRKRMDDMDASTLDKYSSDVKEAARLSGRTEEEMTDMSVAWMRSGMSSGVDKSTLLDDGFDSLISGSKAAKAWAALVKYPRKGFDIGEKTNLMTAWLAHYDKALAAAKAEGKTKLDQKALDEVAARARNYTLNMNAAGEPPYNKNSLSLAFQYMQVPHKSVTQVFNRGLTKAERARLAAVHLAVLPTPPALGIGLINYFTETTGVEIDEDTRYMIMNGLEGMFLNKALSLMTGEESSSDWSSLASFDPNAPYELVKAIMTTDIMEIIAATPSGSLFVGHNPRVANIARETIRFIAPPEGEPRELGVLLETFANYSSGAANLSKSAKALMTKKFYNSMGAMSDDDVSRGEAIAKAFGFRSFEEAMNYEVKQGLYLQSKEARDDIKEFVKLQSQALARRGITQEEADYQIKMISSFNHIGAFQTQAHKELFWSELERQAMKNQNDALLNQIMKSAKYEDPNKLSNLAHTAGYGEQMDEIIELIRNIKDESGDK